MLGEGGRHPAVDARPQAPVSVVPQPRQPQPQFPLPWSPVPCVLLMASAAPCPPFSRRQCKELL